MQNVQPPVAKPKPYGSGRIVFLSQIDAIRTELSAGHTVQAIFNQRAKALGIGYSAFRKLVQRYAEDAKPRPVGMKGSNVSPNKTNPEHSGLIDPAKLKRFTG